jgi:uncharacterized phage-like protein YoqJ
MIVAGTGHRPDKLGGYGDDVFKRLVVLARSYLEQLQPWHVISGMALGWDQALAMAAVKLGIPFTAAVPFADFHSKWPQQSKEVYYRLVREAQHVQMVSEPGYEPWKLQARNEWMVDHADRMVALYMGGNGGTSNCLIYAVKQKVPVDNLINRWLDMCN